jgi:hypothetical protein
MIMMKLVYAHRFAEENQMLMSRDPQPTGSKPFVEIAAEAASERPQRAAKQELWRRSAPAATPLRESTLRRIPRFFALPLMLLGAVGLISFRCALVKQIPQLAGVYRLMGAPVNCFGLDIRNLRSRLVEEYSRKVLAIDGEIVNLRKDSNHAPPVELTIRAANGQSKYAWTTRMAKSRLEPGEILAFHARLASPPADGADMVVRFAREESAPPRERENAPPREKSVGLGAIRR